MYNKNSTTVPYIFSIAPQTYSAFRRRPKPQQPQPISNSASKPVFRDLAERQEVSAGSEELHWRDHQEQVWMVEGV